MRFISVCLIIFCIFVSSVIAAEDNSKLLKGDMDSDGRISAEDYALLIQAAIDPKGYCQENGLDYKRLLDLADINQNGLIDMRDASLLKELNSKNPYTGKVTQPKISGIAHDRFPIGVWLQSPSRAGEYKEIGINLYVCSWKGPKDSDLKTLKKFDMPLICEQNEHGLRNIDDPTICAWIYPDEPDNLKKGKNGYLPPIMPDEVSEKIRQIKMKDPGRQVLLNLGVGVAWDGWYGRGARTNKPEDYPAFYKEADIASFDFYPFANAPRMVRGDVWRIGEGVRRVIGWTKGEKKVWSVIETGPIKSDLGPTPENVRSEVWMAVINGARGIIYFVHRFHPKFCDHELLKNKDMAQAVSRINSRLAELAPVLNKIPAKDKPRVARNDSLLGVEVRYILARNDNYLYVFAIPMGKDKVRVVFELADYVDNAKAEVLDEGRFVEVRNGLLEDAVENWSARLYRIALPEKGAGDGGK